MREILQKLQARKGIEVIAVTKTAEVPQIREAMAAGFRVFGENRVQEAEPKILTLRDSGVSWHLIGHLQTNKAKLAVSLFSMIQSVDSVKIAERISREAEGLKKTMRVLLEVNISGQTQKYGFKPQSLRAAALTISKLPSILVQGLMGIAPYPASTDVKRTAFRSLKEIFLDLKKMENKNLTMRYLSMGMSDDFEIAIQEGSNMVRIGRAIFGESTV